MIGAGDFLVARRHAARAPILDDDLALAQELGRFERADHGVERSPGGHLPIQRRHPPRFGVVEPQIGVLRNVAQRRQIEHAGDRIGRRHQIGRRVGREGLPVLRQQAGGQMSAGGMAVHEDALAPLTPQEQTGAAHLLDDGGDRDLRTEIVTGNRDADAARIRPGRRLAEHRRIERAPPAAVNEQSQRRHLVVVFCRKQVDGLARRGAVTQAEFGAARGFAIGRRLALPARENLRMLGHPGAVIVFGFVVDRRHGALLFRRRAASYPALRWAETALSLAP